MKFMCCVATGAFLFAGNAYAQSSVTLYGIVDEGINYNSNMNGSRSFAMQGGVMQGSRWGLRGTEDLGGGYGAVFVLENGFDVNTGKLGQGGLLFGRQASVGITTPYGAFTFGRQYASAIDFVSPIAVSNQWAGNVGTHPADVDNLNDTFRVNNTIKFKSISYSGFSFGGDYSVGGVAGDATRNQVWSFGAGYVMGPLQVGVGYLNARNPNISLFGNATSGTASPALANTTYPVFSGFTSAHAYQLISTGIAYTLGAATLGATYSNIAFKGLGDITSGPNPSGYKGSVHFNSAELSMKYQISPALLVGLAYNYTNSSSVSSATGINNGGTYHQGMAGIDYFLSRRTDIYLLGTYQKASGTDSRNLPAIASINNQSSPSDNDHQAVIRIGIRHKF
ncbi:porin [Paraburkholderia sp. Ac-20336]|uniref:porin n=1 Tax=Paraburkholderia sp. Ac-20336 TaxID=2703886 RepID=UPI0019825B0F|nr:porin [Paraburkholderia sp. Ac-20336]MBN3801922.1 porin [Paraburkholderia sp. Ac-20336]